MFWLKIPASLQQRLRQLPPQVRPDNHEFQLTMDRKIIEAELQRVRTDETSNWPQVHYLWPLHPVMEWFTDRALHAFGRHTAPVLRLPNELNETETIVLLHGGYPNKRGYTLLQDWVAIRFTGRDQKELLSWPELKQRLQLEPGTLPNRGEKGDTAELVTLLPDAVTAARAHLKEVRSNFLRERQPELDRLNRNLENLKRKHVNLLEAELEQSAQLESVKAARERRERDRIERLFQDHRDWLENTQEIVDSPYLQVVAVFTGLEA